MIKNDQSIRIGSRFVGNAHEPFIIAEMSGNHNQSLERALTIVEAAAKSGAHALKLQTYTADTMTLDIKTKGFTIDDPASLWEGQSLYELYDKAHTPWEWHETIYQKCHALGLICFSTPFDSSAVDFLEELNTPAYKVASFESTDFELLRRIARTGKPMLISTGMMTLAEMDETVRLVRSERCKDLILLKCTSAYPAQPRQAHIKTIPHMRNLFGTQIGLSDHTKGIGVALAATAHGATVIEKHFTLSRSDGGVDSAFSLEPSELKMLAEESQRVWESLGHVQYGLTNSEKKSLQFRRSLYVVQDLKAGDVLTRENVRAIRPGLGMPPKLLERVLGLAVNQNVDRGTALSWGLLK